MKATTTKLYNWATLKASSKHAPLWIGFLFLLEIALFMPLDAILMFFCLQNPRKTFLYVLIAAFASMISAAAGYLLGHFLWDLIGTYIVPHLISHASFDRISGHFQLYEHWAVFFGGLFPIPLKALSISGGVFHLGLTAFVTSFLAARLLRFAAIGLSVLFWGEQVKRFVDRHFHRLILLIGAKVVIIFTLFWFIA